MLCNFLNIEEQTVIVLNDDNYFTLQTKLEAMDVNMNVLL